MARLKLKTEPRATMGTNASRHARAEGKVPAVLYGKGEPTQHLWVDGHALEIAIRSGGRMLDLEVSGKAQPSFLREVQRDAIEDTLIHADFHHVRMDQVLRARVPLHFKGVAAGILEGGIVTQILHEITVECLPADLPEAVDCPIAHLKLDQAMHLKDLPLPPRVKAVGEPEILLVHVQKPKEALLAAATAEGETKEPELIRKERAEGEGDEKDEKKPAEGKAAKPAEEEKGKEKEKKK